MDKKEQTNGSSRLNIVIGEFETDKEKNITMPPEKSKKLTIASIARIKELEENGCLEIPVENHIAERDSKGKIIKRTDSNGKILTAEKQEIEK